MSPDPRKLSRNLTPDIEALGLGVGLHDLAQVRGEPSLLKASCAFGSVRGWIQAERWPKSRRPRGTWPRCHQPFLFSAMQDRR
jgi:hypothetical protein